MKVKNKTCLTLNWLCVVRFVSFCFILFIFFLQALISQSVLINFCPPPIFFCICCTCSWNVLSFFNRLFLMFHPIWWLFLMFTINSMNLGSDSFNILTFGITVKLCFYIYHECKSFLFCNIPHHTHRKRRSVLISVWF